MDVELCWRPQRKAVLRKNEWKPLQLTGAKNNIVHNILITIT